MLNFQIAEASEDAKYKQIRDAVVAAIKDGRLEPMSKLPSISQIAKDAGVSLRTADMALQALIHEGFCFRRPKKGTFVSAKKRGGKQQVCGVLGRVNSIAFPLQALLSAGIIEASIRRNVSALSIPLPFSGDDPGILEKTIRRCDSGSEFDLKGVLIMDPYYYKVGISLAKTFPEKRFFILNYEINDFSGMPDNMFAVINDNYGGSRGLAQNVFARYSPKTVSCLTMKLSEDDITYRERERGIRDAAKAAGVKVTERISVSSCGFHSDQVDFAREAVLDFFKKNKTDFIFAANDLFAQGAKKAVEQLGAEGVGVGGYDGIFDIVGQNIPTVKIPYMEMGRIGVEKMLEPDPGTQHIIKLLPEIIMNGETNEK